MGSVGSLAPSHLVSLIVNSLAITQQTNLRHRREGKEKGNMRKFQNSVLKEQDTRECLGKCVFMRV
jgi:hypothetical protein